MKLDRVRILNFRSLKEVTVSFDTLCRVLVGINESGKSNVLRALSMLNNEIKPVRATDLRDALPDEDPITRSEIQFVFELEEDELSSVFEKVSKQVLASESNPIMVSYWGKLMTLRDFCNGEKEGLYTADILKEKKLFQWWTLSTGYKLVGKWKKPSSGCPKDYEVEVNGTRCKLLDFKIIQADLCEGILASYLVDATADDVSRALGNCKISIIEEKLPKALFWEYDEANLLPNSIKISDFINNPDTCKPLKNMFALSNIYDVKKSVEEAKKGTDNQFQNFLSRIAKKTTIHFQNVWKEYRDIEFTLRLNADQIIPGIKEQNTHDFTRRSDGFKRFVTFLLMISVNVVTEDFENTLLLVDEPDISLHPSGARYLRDELIRISKNNYVVYSTHSIFMIDPSDIGRHLIVKKNSEITTVESAIDSNIADEEILYNALGYSVFSILKENNIIFEGWKDKKLFQIALDGANSSIKKKFSNVSPCHAKGVKSIKAITPLIELAKRKCIIISDNGKPALTQQKDYQKEKGYGEWKTYKDIDPTIDAVTGEDFIKNEFILSEVNSLLVKSNIPIMDISLLPKTDKLNAISKWLSENGLGVEQVKETLATIKNQIFENLAVDNIENSYNKMLKGIVFS